MPQGLSRSRRRASLLGFGLLLLRVGLGLAKVVEYADVNRDGEVNFLDVAQVQRCVGQDPQSRPFTECHMADTNSDDRIDAADLAIVTRQLGRRDYSFYIDPNATFVLDPRGGQYPINRVSIVLQEHVTRAEAEALAAIVGGRIVGFSSRPPTYSLEVPRRRSRKSLRSSSSWSRIRGSAMPCVQCSLRYKQVSRPT